MNPARKALFVVGACACALVAAAGDWTRDALDRMAHPPLGLPQPAADRPSAAEIALGRKLFLDPALSGNGSTSCATCHVPEQGFTQNDRSTPEGGDGKPLRRNASTLLNVAYAGVLMHDGEAPSLASQTLVPLFEPREMANANFAALVERLQVRADYQGVFETVYGEGASVPLIGKAIAAYERSLVSANSAFDRWRFGGERDALTAEAQRGFALFAGKAGCARCHAIGERTALFTDQSFHNTGIGYAAEQARSDGRSPPPADDRGREEVTFKAEDRFKFKTPTLRNVARTAPYMHDGSLPTLANVVRYYDRGGSADPDKDPAIQPLGLSDDEVAALVAFLEALTGDNLAALAAEARAVSGSP